MRQHQETLARTPANGLAMKKVYQLRLGFRLLLSLGCFLLFFFKPDAFDVLDGWQFFHRFSWLHIAWIIWMASMLTQLWPGNHRLLLGSKKQLPDYYTPVNKNISQSTLRAFIRDSRKNSLKVAVAWLALTGLIAGFKFSGLLGSPGLLLLTTLLYISDLICVLFWCPFQVLFMKNRCCTTCMIFNWDQIMIFTPAAFIGGFYAMSLFFMSLVVLVIWELRIIRYPERFYEQTNRALTCETAQIGCVTSDPDE